MLFFVFYKMFTKKNKILQNKFNYIYVFIVKLVMANLKKLNDFETLSTYNFINKKSAQNSKLKKQNISAKMNNNSGEILYQQQTLSPEFNVVSPSSLQEINNVINCLKNNQTIILDLTYKKSELTSKVLNYLNGAVFALEGKINKLMDNTYLIVPKGIKINGN